MAAHVREGQLDFAFVALASPQAPGLRLTPLACEPLHLAVHEDHPLAHRAEIELSAVTEESFADGPPGYRMRLAVDRAFAAAGLKRRVTLEVNDASTLIDFVRYGPAVAFLARSFIRDSRTISMIPIGEHAPVFATYLAEPADRRPSAAAAALIALAKRSAAAPAEPPLPLHPVLDRAQAEGLVTAGDVYTGSGRERRDSP